MTQKNELSATRVPGSGQPGTAYQVVVRRSSLHPAAALTGAGRLVRGAIDTVSAALADVYLLGARAALERKEALEDKLAARRAPPAPADSTRSPRN